MGHYPLNPGMRPSHRNPFQGLGRYGEYAPSDLYDYDISALDRNLVGVQGYGAYGDVLGMKDETFARVEPWLKGLLTGFATYATAKLVKIDGKKAVQLGVVVGGLEIATQFLSKLVKGVGGSTATVEVPKQ